MSNVNVLKEVKAFTDQWTDNDQLTRKAFLSFVGHLESMDSIELDFAGRPGVTYSLRAKHPAQADRNLFAMVDVIDDDPDDRWLSICFYEDLLSDPDEKGDLIPEGLSGDDGYCFDLDEWEDSYVEYIKDRLTEAFRNAAK